ncbi:MAG: efflux RND transporter periplasmic adaptor subunit, partial [Chloroflexi bacterium]|nr:efflux RND transporter periplasmic adaptor subunit [Chloroflexota bacterium]
MRRFLIFALLAAALAAGGYYFWNQRRQAQLAAAAVPLRSAQIARGTLAASVSAAGSIAPQGRAELAFSAPGRVAEAPVKVGDVVHKGDLLMRLEDADLLLALEQARVNLTLQQIARDQLLAPPREVDLAVLQAAVALAEAQVTQAAQNNNQTAVDIAQRNLELAQLALEQTYVLLDQAHKAGQDESVLKSQERANLEAIQVAQLRLEGAKRAPTGGPLAAAEASLAAAQAALQAAEKGPGEQDRRIARLQVSQAQTALEQARADLARTRLLAPFDGVVAVVNLEPGELAGGPLPAVVLVDLSQLHMDVSVDEVDVARLRVGQRVQVTADALPDVTLAGTVDRLAP